MADHYATLGVRRDATADEIRKAYLRLVKDRHPDRFSDPAEKKTAQEAFQQITEAFNTLSNERTRREHDTELARPRLETPEEIAKDAQARGLARLEQRDYAAAVELLRIAVHHVPRQAEYQAALARALAGQSHTLREAIQAYEKAIELAPRQVGYQVELATLLAGQGLKLRARKVVEAALRLAPSDSALARLAAGLGAGQGEEGNPPPPGGRRGLFGRKG